MPVDEFLLFQHYLSVSFEGGGEAEKDGVTFPSSARPRDNVFEDAGSNHSELAGCLVSKGVSGAPP